MMSPSWEGFTRNQDEPSRPTTPVAGRAFERGGIGGLIEEGFFEALMLSGDLKGGYDGGALGKYRPTGEKCSGYQILRKIKPTSP